MILTIFNRPNFKTNYPSRCFGVFFVSIDYTSRTHNTYIRLCYGVSSTNEATLYRIYAWGNLLKRDSFMHMHRKISVFFIRYEYYMYQITQYLIYIIICRICRKAFLYTAYHTNRVSFSNIAKMMLNSVHQTSNFYVKFI